MGSLADLLGQRLYLDANIFIYAIEDFDPWGRIATRIMQAIDSGECSAVTSELTLAECLVKPLQIGRADIAKIYSDAIRPRPFLAVSAVARPVLIRAAQIRAGRGIKLPDAIHAATAILTGCKVYLTNDLRIQSMETVEAVQISSLPSP